MDEKPDKGDKKKILFLCTHNAARSQMAEAFVNALYGGRYEAHSAGSEPTEVHSCAIEVMAEKGINIASQRAKPLDEYVDVSFDYVVTMCADAKRGAPFSLEPFSLAGSIISITHLTILSLMLGMKCTVCVF